MSDREIVTIALGGFGVLAATQWANGLSQYEVENSNCVFQELNSRSNAKAVRAVFLDQSYQSSIKEDLGPVENVEKELHSTLDVNPKLDVMNIFAHHHHQHHAKKSNHNKKSSSKIRKSNIDDEEDDSDDEEENDHHSGWPRTSATSIWARGNAYDGEDHNDDDDEEEEEEDYNDDDDDDDRSDNGGRTDADGKKSSAELSEAEQVARDIQQETHRPPSTKTHHPWWQYLTAPHRKDLDRVVSFMDLPSATDSGGWSQLRSFGFGFFDNSVRSYLENSEKLTFLDNLRKELECCDHLQGAQLFADSDSVFGGIATYLSSHVLGDEFGFKRTMAISCFPDAGEKDYASANAMSADDEGAMLPEALDLLLEDNRNLNRGLATSLLSDASACYIPHEIHSWGQLMKSFNDPRVLPGLRTDDDIATASIVATFQDSILMPCRGVTSTVAREVQTNPSHSYIAPPDSIGIAGSQLECCTSNFTAGQFMELLRPSPTMKVQGAYLALPFMRQDPSLTLFEEAGAQQHSFYDDDMTDKGRRDSREKPKNHSVQALLFNILDSSAPLLNPTRGSFRPLSGFVVDANRVDTVAHQIVAHAYTIRAGLPWLGSGEDHRSSMREALVEYTLHLRCPNFVGYAIREPLPLSATFPKRMFAPLVEKRDKEGAKSVAARLQQIKTVSSGAHAVTTHSAGSYLKQVHQGAMRKNMNLRADARARESMCVCGDTWRELEEDLAALTDNYYFEGPDDNGDVSEED